MKTDVIILASGFSKRFQGNKLLYPFHGKPLITWTLEKLLQLPIDQILVVSNNSKIEEIVKQYRAKCIRNMNAEHGQSASIHEGILHSTADQVMLMVADQPYMKLETLNTMLEKADGSHIVCASFQGIIRNPAIFPRKYFKDLLTLQKEQGGKVVIKTYIEDVLMVECKKEELKDIDTKEDIKK